MSITRCCRCGRLTEAPVTVGWRDTGSGPGHTISACPDCAPTVPVGPSPEDQQSLLNPR